MMKIIPARKSQAAIIVYFDGECLLCNGTVDWLMRKDSLQQLKFATLQGQHGQLVQQKVGMIDSVLVSEGTDLYSKSDAVLRLGEYLGGWPRLLAGASRIVPRILRDCVYDHIARHRLQWFGRRETCRRPRPDEHERFLD